MTATLLLYLRLEHKQKPLFVTLMCICITIATILTNVYTTLQLNEFQNEHFDFDRHEQFVKFVVPFRSVAVIFSSLAHWFFA